MYGAVARNIGNSRNISDVTNISYEKLVSHFKIKIKIARNISESSTKY